MEKKETKQRARTRKQRVSSLLILGATKAQGSKLHFIKAGIAGFFITPFLLIPYKLTATNI